MEPQELLDRYTEGERDFPGVDLSDTTWQGHDFSDLNLEGADLSNSDFKNMTFNQANLKNCNFSESTFPSIKFVEADLTNACFIKSDLHIINFAWADLTGAKFGEYRRFSSCEIAKATTKNVNFDKVSLYDINWSSLDLELCSFYQADLSGINLTSSNCKNCNFKWQT